MLPSTDRLIDVFFSLQLSHSLLHDFLILVSESYLKITAKFDFPFGKMTTFEEIFWVLR